jgi:AbiV family abortive infection protein
MNSKFLDLNDFIQFEMSTLINMSELLSEAKLLFKFNHYARAFSLFYFSFEENAKITLYSFLMFDHFISIERTNDDIQTILKANIFKDHRKKLRLAFLSLPGYDYQKSVKIIHALVELKNRSLYSDFFEGEMCKPSDFFGKDQLRPFIDIATNTFEKRIKEYGVNSIKEVNLEKIKNHYFELRENISEKIFTLSGYNQTGIPQDFKNYYDLLTTIICHEGEFNLFKSVLKNQSS